MNENNNSGSNSIELNDEATNSIESETQTNSINSRASNVWKYFVNVDIIEYMCKICKEKNPHYSTIIKKNAHSSTTNFWRHLEIFHATLHDNLKGKSSGKKQRSIIDLMSSSSQKKQYYTGITFEKTKEMIGRFIYKKDQPWLVVEDPDFRNLLCYCAQMDLRIPMRRTVRDHIQETFVKEKTKLKEMLSSVRRVSLTIDGWTTDNHISLLGITVHWINNEWMLRERVLALEKLEGEHSGEYLAKVLRTVLKEFSLEKKVQILTFCYHCCLQLLIILRNMLGCRYVRSQRTMQVIMLQ